MFIDENHEYYGIKSMIACSKRLSMLQHSTALKIEVGNCFGKSALENDRGGWRFFSFFFFGGRALKGRKRSFYVASLMNLLDIDI